MIVLQAEHADQTETTMKLSETRTCCKSNMAHRPGCPVRLAAEYARMSTADLQNAYGDTMAAAELYRRGITPKNV